MPNRTTVPSWKQTIVVATVTFLFVLFLGLLFAQGVL